MSIFHRHQLHPQSFLKLLTIFLPLFCLLSWAASTTIPPPSSALAASYVLKSRGYSLFATLIAVGADSWDGTGTVLAPSDFAFSFAAAKFTDRRFPPPRPSAALLLRHTLKEPLTWHNLTARGNGHELLTWHTNHCVTVSKGINGNLVVGEGKKLISAVKIRHPNLYVDDHLTVHGIDDVMDPASVSNCSDPNRTAKVKSEIDRSFLDHAVRSLRRRGFGVVATAMSIKRADLITSTDITVLAPSDASLFSVADGLRYDFLHHVLPKRHRFTDIATLSKGTAMETLSPNKTVVIGSKNGDVTVNGVAIHSSEVYHNRWIVVLSVSRSIDDAGNSEAKAQNSGNVPDSVNESGDFIGENQFAAGISSSPSPAPSYFQFPGKFSEEDAVFQYLPAEKLVPSRTGEHGQGEAGETSLRSPSLAAEFIFGQRIPGDVSVFEESSSRSPVTRYFGDSEVNTQFPNKISVSEDARVQFPAGEIQSPASARAAEGSRLSPSPAAGRKHLTDGVVSSISLAVEGIDLLCPVTVRSLRESSAYVEKSAPSTGSGQLSEKLVQSGPSHEHNSFAKQVVKFVPSDENESGESREPIDNDRLSTTLGLLTKEKLSAAKF
ncbi:Fasciclin-like arabinogalactan protein [Actinidia chinensis var. chinensis]|uniref:Fasciclin-like arabinogalactan protein n=1 Tax=Actinidia chinensis var. chinensis TaxID=1590841 RepID=A0A2R6RAG5_ACTCC|nr:Fasciclin-like arabinogalactan protein [Actinidia chinensis var. chinensis]